VTASQSNPTAVALAIDRSVRLRAWFVEAASSGSWLAGAAPEPPFDTIDRWGAAMAAQDVDEVDRLVRCSRDVRLEDARAGRLGTMLGGAATAADPLGAVA